ncbi:MAG: Ig-like domain-containing protein [Dysgonamonadaceae bacterium]|jgi:hypothetical protein|nr:Ig-like domain-containing protein [Dysgonamonadaceae bacterium]
MRYRLLFMTLAVFITAGAYCAAVVGRVITVASTNDSGTGTFRQAVSDASTGDTIIFDASLEGATITLESSVRIERNLTVRGGGQTFVPKSEGYPAIFIPNGSDISGGTDGDAEPVTVFSRLRFDGFRNTTERQGRGGAISSGKTGTLKLYSCIFSNNSANDEGMAVSKIWGPNGPSYADRFFAYGCTFYNNGSGDAVLLHEEYPWAAGNIFFTADGSKGIRYDPTVTSQHFVRYNVYNSILVEGNIGETNVKLTEWPLDETFRPVSYDVKILPADLSELPDDYPKTDFYGFEIKPEGYAGAAQLVCFDDEGKVTECVPVDLTGVSLADSEARIFRGYTTVRLIPVFTPSNATTRKVTWSSADETVATVDKDGVVSGVSAGMTTITVTTVDGGFTAEAIITVTEPDPCVFRYDRTGWTAKWASSSHRENGPDCMFDDVYNDSPGWHNAGGCGENKYAETIVIDMQENKDIGKVVFYTTGYQCDALVFLSDTEVEPVHDSATPGGDLYYPVGNWNCPEKAEDITPLYEWYGTGDGMGNAVRTEIEISGERSARYVVIALLNTRGGGAENYGEWYRNISEVEIFRPCTPVEILRWEVGAENVPDVVATLSEDSTILTVSGKGAIKDFSIYDDNVYVGGDAPWVAELIFGGDNGETLIEAIRKPYAEKIETVIVEDGITKVGSAFGYGISNLNSLSLPATIDTIGARAFSNHRLQADTLWLPEGLRCIGDYAFKGLIPTVSSSPEFRSSYEMNAVKSLVLPSTLDSIGEYAFDGLTLLESIYNLSETPQKLSDKSVFGTLDTEKTTLYVPYGKRDSYAMAEVWKEFLSIVELPGVIPAVTLPYDSGERLFVDDTLSFLTGSYPDAHNDGVVAVKFSVDAPETLRISVATGYVAYLFNSESLTEKDLVWMNLRKALPTVDAGTYYLVVDDYPVDKEDALPESSFDVSPEYRLIIEKSITGTGNIGKAVKSIEYFDLLGRTVNGKPKGIVIKRVRYDDETVKTTKEYIKD